MLSVGPVRVRDASTSHASSSSPAHNLTPIVEALSESGPVHGGNTSSSNLPSLEHGRFDHPRPRPTRLSPPVSAKSRKGKGPQRSSSPPESDWLPSENDISNDDFEQDHGVRPGDDEENRAAYRRTGLVL